jgi:hypothetical protein
MRKNSLSDKGLSLSQAQSISNLCFQRTQDIANQLGVINNSEKTLKIGQETYIETQGNPIPKNVVDLILEKGLLHAAQAFLMENIKAKDLLLKELKSKGFVSPLIYPDYVKYHSFEAKEFVEEKWGWEQLSVAEYNEFLEAEAFAAHIGQFIHKNGILDRLRSELPNIKTLEWIELEVGKKSPVIVTPHHTPEYLSELHEELSALHRKYEQRVNYFKSKIKNAVTAENARRAKVNGDEQAQCNEYNQTVLDAHEKALREWNNAYKEAHLVWEEARLKEIENIINLKIEVPTRFQPVVDEFLNSIK